MSPGVQPKVRLLHKQIFKATSSTNKSPEFGFSEPVNFHCPLLVNTKTHIPLKMFRIAVRRLFFWAGKGSNFLNTPSVSPTTLLSQHLTMLEANSICTGDVYLLTV